MVKKSTNNITMERFAINNIIKLKKLESEIELERASSLYLKLRTLEQEDSSYTQIRKYIKKLILDYELEYWSDESKITDEQVKDSDLAEALVQAENEFNQKRKELIRQSLNKKGIKQGDLANILGHRKGYMSELINGLRPFSKEDIVIMNRLLKVKFEDLVPPFIKQDKAVHIKKTLKLIKMY